VRKDIALIPHFFNHKWAKDLNKTLSEIFFVPDKYMDYFEGSYQFKEGSYLPGKSQLHQYISELLPVLRNQKIENVFYSNILDDYSADLQNAGFVKSFGGILHATNHQDLAIGQQKKLIDYENSIMKMSKQTIVASELMKNQVPYNVDVMGLPVHMEFQYPSVSKKILFSHRLMKDKNIDMLLELPEELKEKIIVTCPSGSTTYVGKVKKAFKRFYFKKPKEIYLQLIKESGFGLSFAIHDNFGYSLMEGIYSGLTYFVHDNDCTTYREFVLDELRFKTIDELLEKYNYYCDNPKERIKVVKRQQEKVKKFQVESWVDNFQKGIKL
jgi:glycosyltransferase involved in cell wall biosynthesis|tara:strand:+ start:485 stop:1462 length:978 start_codon:yes stop_codon:yes gene_type:complete